MNPSKFYGAMVDEIEDVDMRKAARCLSYHVGEENAVSIEALSFAVFGAATEKDVRKTRLVLERLIEQHGFPVCSHSGKSGRWLPGTKDEILKAAQEREDRAVKLMASAKRLRSAELPAKLPRIGEEAQPGLGI